MRQFLFALFLIASYFSAQQPAASTFLVTEKGSLNFGTYKMTFSYDSNSVTETTAVPGNPAYGKLLRPAISNISISIGSFNYTSSAPNSFSILQIPYNLPEYPGRGDIFIVSPLGSAKPSPLGDRDAMLGHGGL